MSGRVLIVLILLASPFAISAATLRVESGVVVGIDSLLVGPTTYNVSFIGGSFDDVFTDTGLVSAFWGDNQGAADAATALKSAVEADGNYENSPTLFSGCGFSTQSFCRIFTPSANGPSTDRVTGAIMSISDSGLPTTSTATNYKNIDYSYGTNAVYSVVPIPASAFLFLSALGGLGWIKRRRS